MTGCSVQMAALASPTAKDRRTMSVARMGLVAEFVFWRGGDIVFSCFLGLSS